MIELSRRGKVIQATSAFIAFFAGMGIVGANDYQDATRGASEGATPTMWAIFTGAVIVYGLLEALRHSK